MRCEECNMPVDDSNDGIGLPPVEAEGKTFCGVQCLHEFAERVTRNALENIPAINFAEALRLREGLR